MSDANAAYSTRDIVYSSHDGKPLLARLYRPNGAGPFPAIVEVHGGAWTAGDRLRNAPIAAALAASGIVVLSIDFRMPPEAVYPASLIDINCAIRWFKAHADEFAVDAARVGGLGTSSGGHQIVLSAMRPRHAAYISGLSNADEPDASVAFVVACWPILDPLQRYAMAKANGRRRLVEGHDAYWVTEAAMADGNPQRILDRHAPPDLPPLLIIQGTNDDNVDHTTIDQFAKSYSARGGEIEFEKFEGEPHAFIRTDVSAPSAAKALSLIEAFIKCHGAPNAEVDHSPSSHSVVVSRS